MASTPKIWYYPAGDMGTLEEIDLLENVSDLQEIPETVSASTESLNGLGTTVHYRSRLRVRIILERFTSAALARKLTTLQQHLAKGGIIGFAQDSDKAWAGYTSRGYPRGATVLMTNGNTWSYNTAAAFGTGTEVVVQSNPPECNRALHTVSAMVTATSESVSISGGLTYDYDAPWVLVRQRDFYPALRFAAGDVAPILTAERRLAYTLDMTLVEDLQALSIMSGIGPGFIGGTTESDRTANLSSLLQSASIRSVPFGGF